MSKYDFDLNLSEKTSTGLILKKIKPGSTVLEFGCATGRMTKYMCEELNCSVFIVEVDADSYRIAREYATDGLCDDILHFKWTEKFKEIKFDAIIMADVLEHLTDPESVLKKSLRMLKPDGYIYFSIPNITHNDVILKAMCDRFDYTELGLLDDSHVHFWGLENLLEFPEKLHFNIEKIEATFLETGLTEQKVDKSLLNNRTLMDCLKERACGTVYQFVVTMSSGCADIETKLELGTKAVQIAPEILRQSEVRYTVYLDYGDDSEETDKVIGSACICNGKYIIDTCIDSNGDEKNRKLKRIRILPAEGRECIISDMSVMLNDVMVKSYTSEKIDLSDGSILLFGSAPMVFADVDALSGKILIHMTVELYGDSFTDKLLKGLSDGNACQKHLAEQNVLMKETIAEQNMLMERTIAEQNILMERTIAEKDKDLTEKTAELEDRDALLNEKNEEISELNKTLENNVKKTKKAEKKFEDNISQLESELERMNKMYLDAKTDLDAYITVSNRKDEVMLNLEKNLSEREKLIKEQKEQISILEKNPGVRIHRFAGRIRKYLKS